MIPTITDSGANGKNKVAANDEYSDSSNAPQSTAARAASARHITVNSWGKYHHRSFAALTGIDKASRASCFKTFTTLSIE